MVSGSPGTRGGWDIWSKRAMHSKDSDWSIGPKLISEVSQKFFIFIESGSCWKKALVLESEEPNSSLGFIMNHCGVLEHTTSPLCTLVSLQIK